MGDKGSPLPLHEATAASEPNFTVVKYLMEHYPDHVQTQDEVMVVGSFEQHGFTLQTGGLLASPLRGAWNDWTRRGVPVADSQRAH